MYYSFRTLSRWQLLSLALVLAIILPATVQAAAIESTAAGASSRGSSAAREMQNAFIVVARELRPSVVNIRVERSESAQEGPSMDLFGAPEDSPFGDFFNKFFKEHPGKHHFKTPHSPFKSEGAGSGVIFDEKGTILTNNHVVKGATTITVKLQDGRELKAKVVGQDPQSDLAVVRVESPTPLPAAKFADSDGVQVGEWAIAIGSPMGLEQTVTVGVVSAVGRSGLGASPIEDFIQTDAGINPGNSGGPLVDIDGNVMGINTLIFNAPGAGIGFAIPSNMCKRVAAQIVSSGSVERPYVGITMSAVTPELAEHYSLPDKNGTVVMEVSPNTPASKAGLQQMDIIRSIDDKPMNSSNDVQKLVLSHKVDDVLQLKILRAGAEKTLAVKLERMPRTFGLKDPEDLAETPKAKEKADEPEPQEKLGFVYKKLTPEVCKSMRLEESIKGLLVTEIEEGSSADRGGLQESDVITQVNNQPVSDEASLKTALKAGNTTKKSSVFVVMREGSPMFLVIPEEAAASKKEK
ncbi:MAG: Do family serine endopeptidase [Candidatus Riflebacteria bacterium]|nr:Do family serine endopeptidase [Candidatus Riflebacteria bacterium]